jgi:hypothetical protein
MFWPPLPRLQLYIEDIGFGFLPKVVCILHEHAGLGWLEANYVFKDLKLYHYVTVPLDNMQDREKLTTELKALGINATITVPSNPLY